MNMTVKMVDFLLINVLSACVGIHQLIDLAKLR